MIDLDRELRVTLDERARLAPPPVDTRSAIRVARRRQLGVILAALAVVAAVALGSVAGISALTRSSERRIPAGPNETPVPSTVTPAPAVVSGSGLDGYVETAFPLVGWHMSSHLAVAPDGTVWAAVWPEGGETGVEMVARFDGRTWTTYTTDDGLPRGPVWTVDVAPDGTVWAGTERGLARLDGETWTVVLPRVGVDHVAFAPDGSVLAALYTSHGQGPDPTLKADIGRFDGQTWSTMRGSGTLPEELEDIIRCLDISPVDGSMWACAGNGSWVPFKGIWRFDGGDWTSWLEDEWPVDWEAGYGGASALRVRTDGSVWVLGSEPTGEGSLAVFDGATWTFLPVPFGSHLEGPMVIGPDGTTWFVGSPDRLYSFDGTSWTSDRLGGNVLALDVTPDGTLWVSLEDSLVRFTPVGS